MRLVQLDNGLFVSGAGQGPALPGASFTIFDSDGNIYQYL